MPRTIHPVLKAGASTALALALTATTVLPASAAPDAAHAPGQAAIPAITADSPSTDPAIETGQAASEITGAQDETLALGGIDAKALPDAEDAAESSASTASPSDGAEPSDQAQPTEQAQPTRQSEPATSSSGSPAASPTASSSPATPTAPTAPASPTAAPEAADPDTVAADLTSLRVPTTATGTGTERDAADREDRPADVVLRGLQERAEAAPSAVRAPAADEAESLTPTVLDTAAASTRELDVEGIATLTQPVETIDFIVAGVTWDIADAGHVTDVSLRVREQTGWTDWNSMEIHSGDEMPTADRVGTEPLVSTGADAIQVRVTTVDGTEPAGLELDLIDPGTAETDGALEPASPASPALAEVEAKTASATAPTTGTTAADTFTPAVQSQQGPLTGTAEASPAAVNHDTVLKPAIITRAQWGANESWTTDWGHTSTDLQAMYVHHTAGSNNYTASGAYQQIRGIYKYHAVTLDWQDIGYQFLVDKYGNIFQGRRGSIDAPVQGAQAGGFNTDTIGVSAMGNYDVTSAPAAMVRAIERVLAWQAYRYDVDPTSRTTLTQSGKGTARWYSGYRANVPTILGHRDTNLTACPGRYLYAQLPTIRANVDAKVSAAVATYGKYAQTPPAPKLPYGRYAVSTDGAVATARWYPVEGADSYQIMYRAVPHGAASVSAKAWVAGKTVTTNRAELSNLPGETAQYAVRAIRNGVAGPQVYLGQHTAPVAWDDADVHTARYQTVSSSGGVQGKAIRARAGTAVVRVEDASRARRLGVALYVPSGGMADLAVYQDNDRYVGTIRVRDNGSAYCALALPGGSNVRLVAQNDTTVTITRLDLSQSGQSDRRASSGDCEVPFRDNAPGSRFYAPVDWMYNAGISSGYSSDNTFRKNRQISRGESVAFVHRYIDPVYSPKQTAPFTDVKSGQTFYEAISWAKDLKISQGYADGSFGVSQDVTRGEFASFLYRAAQPRFSVPRTKAFPDVSVGNAHHAAIAWMEAEGLASGYSDGTFRPTRTITRAEVAAILYRYHRG